MDTKKLVEMVKATQKSELQKRLDMPGLLSLTCTGMRRGVYQEAIPRSTTIFFASLLGVLGLVFTSLGIAVGLNWISSKAKDGTGQPSESGWIIAVVGLVLLVSTYAILSYRNVLVLDRVEGTWFRESGVWPLSRKIQGGYSDLVGLRLVKERRSARNVLDESGHNATDLQVWTTRVVWRDEIQPSFVVALLERECSWTSHEEAYTDATLLATRIGLALLDG